MSINFLVEIKPLKGLRSYHPMLLFRIKINILPTAWQMAMLKNYIPLGCEKTLQKNYRNINNSDYLVLVAQWEPDFDLQHQYKKPGMVAYTENVSFGGCWEGRGRQIPLLSCLVDKSQVIVKGSLSKEQGCLLIRKEVCCVGAGLPLWWIYRN